jgi:hypothetical protein
MSKFTLEQLMAVRNYDRTARLKEQKQENPNIRNTNVNPEAVKRRRAIEEHQERLRFKERYASE